jgi:hypothetical protein
MMLPKRFIVLVPDGFGKGYGILAWADTIESAKARVLEDCPYYPYSRRIVEYAQGKVYTGTGKTHKAQLGSAFDLQELTLQAFATGNTQNEEVQTALGVNPIARLTLDQYAQRLNGDRQSTAKDLCRFDRQTHSQAVSFARDVAELQTGD